MLRFAFSRYRRLQMKGVSVLSFHRLLDFYQRPGFVRTLGILFPVLSLFCMPASAQNSAPFFAYSAPSSDADGTPNTLGLVCYSSDGTVPAFVPVDGQFG